MSKTKKVAKVSKTVKPPKAVPVKARDWTKTLVVFDTNVFKACPDIQKGTWQTFREIARRLQFRIAVPQVVLDELFSQKFRDQDKTLSEYKNKLESVINLLQETSNSAHELYATDLDVNILTKLRKISLNAVPAF